MLSDNERMHKDDVKMDRMINSALEMLKNVFYIYVYILYFVDRASRYKFLLITNLTHFFMYLFISSLYMFRASQCSSSGDRIVLIHHMV